MRVIKNPWKDTFLELVAASSSSINITSPFVKENIVSDIIQTKKESSKVSLITSFKLMNYYTGSSDLSALELMLIKNGRVSNFQKLHSKIYIFDDSVAIITSGNLTNGGLIKNYEYGLLIEEQELVASINNDFDVLLRDENTGAISLDEINQAREIISKVPKTKPITLPEIEIQKESEDIEIYTGGIESILDSLQGWKLEVFKCLLKIPSQKFNLTDINKFVPRLSKVYPDNQNIEPKIRQQLQLLRDIGLIEFLGHGNYKKLWI